MCFNGKLTIIFSQATEDHHLLPKPSKTSVTARRQDTHSNTLLAQAAGKRY
jgi:hypothetical protein